MPKAKKNTETLNKTPCTQCGKPVDDRAPACPDCGTKIYIEHPGGITPAKHEQLSVHRGSK